MNFTRWGGNRLHSETRIHKILEPSQNVIFRTLMCSLKGNFGNRTRFGIGGKPAKYMSERRPTRTAAVVLDGLLWNRRELVVPI